MGVTNLWWWCLVLVVGVASLFSPAQSAVLRHGDQRVQQVFHPSPRNSRQIDLSYPDLSYQSIPTAVYLGQNYESQFPYGYSPVSDYLVKSYPTTLKKPTYYTPQIRDGLLSHISTATPKTSDTYEDNIPHLKFPYVTNLANAAATYRAIADCLQSKLQSAYSSSGLTDPTPAYGGNTYDYASSAQKSNPAKLSYDLASEYDSPDTATTFTPRAGFDTGKRGDQQGFNGVGKGDGSGSSGNTGDLKKKKKDKLVSELGKLLGFSRSASDHSQSGIKPLEGRHAAPGADIGGTQTLSFRPDNIVLELNPGEQIVLFPE